MRIFLRRDSEFNDKPLRIGARFKVIDLSQGPSAGRQFSEETEEFNLSASNKCDEDSPEGGLQVSLHMTRAEAERAVEGLLKYLKQCRYCFEEPIFGEANCREHRNLPPPMAGETFKEAAARAKRPPTHVHSFNQKGICLQCGALRP